MKRCSTSCQSIVVSLYLLIVAGSALAQTGDTESPNSPGTQESRGRSDVCTCACHRDSSVNHFTPCCSVCPNCSLRITQGDFKDHVRVCAMTPDPRVPAPANEKQIGVTADAVPVPEMEATRVLAIERMDSVPDIDDPAFDVYVSATTIGRAYGSVDSALLTDVALQLAEGERVLQRPRKAISVHQALKLAITAASQHNDQASLARLAKFATLRQDNDLEAQVAAAQKLAGVSRDNTTEMMINVQDVDVADYERLRTCLSVIDLARLTGDARALAALESDLENAVPEAFHETMRKRIAETRVSLPEPEDGNEQLVAALERLKAASRCDTPSCD